jgi:hypothetical protein
MFVVHVFHELRFVFIFFKSRIPNYYAHRLINILLQLKQNGSFFFAANVLQRMARERAKEADTSAASGWFSPHSAEQ